MRLVRAAFASLIVASFGATAAAGQGLDDSLRGSVARGCAGSQSVIIRTKPGARETMRKSLVVQGRRVNGEFPTLDAITAQVSCADLKALAGFSHIRLEAKAAAHNSRGNGALRRIGAVQEGILRKSFARNVSLIDQVLWAIIDEDRYRSKAVWGAKTN
jgi:hypothetical protein